MTITPRTGNCSSRRISGRKRRTSCLALDLDQKIESIATGEQNEAAQGRVELGELVVVGHFLVYRFGGKIQLDSVGARRGGQKAAPRVEERGLAGREMALFPENVGGRQASRGRRGRLPS